MNKAVLLVNLGSPDSTSVGDVRRYLNEFLMDRRVIDTPWLFRRFIVGTILINRPKESAHAYEKIWTKEGSPLVVTSRNVREKLAERTTVPVELAMRYQNPSIKDALCKLAGQKVDETLLIPLFPHYAMSSYETAVVQVQDLARKIAPGMKIVVQPPYGDAPDYVAALAASAANHLEAGYDHLLFSFHGIPERHLRKSDPTGGHCLATPGCCQTASPAQATCYRAQCFQTVAAMVKQAPVLANMGVAPVHADTAGTTWDAVGVAGPLDRVPVGQGISDYYLTNPIARASETMAKCSREFSGTAKLAAE